MKEKLMNLKYSLAVMLAALFMTTVFAACGDDDEPGDNIYYSAVLEGSYEGNVDVFIKETTEIKSAFSSTLGVDLSKGVNFHYTGTLERCDLAVRNACTEAKASLAGKTWQGCYVITVTNENTDVKIFEYTFGAEEPVHKVTDITIGKSKEE